jgi:hypothetical protein
LLQVIVGLAFPIVNVPDPISLLEVVATLKMVAAAGFVVVVVILKVEVTITLGPEKETVAGENEGIAPVGKPVTLRVKGPPPPAPLLPVTLIIYSTLPAML